MSPLAYFLPCVLPSSVRSSTFRNESLVSYQALVQSSLISGSFFISFIFSFFRIIVGVWFRQFSYTFARFSFHHFRQKCLLFEIYLLFHILSVAVFTFSVSCSIRICADSCVDDFDV